MIENRKSGSAHKLLMFLFLCIPGRVFALDYVKNTYTTEGWVLSDTAEISDVKNGGKVGFISFKYILHHLKPIPAKESSAVSKEFIAKGSCFGTKLYVTVGSRDWLKWYESVKPMEFDYNKGSGTKTNDSLRPVSPNSIGALALDFACAKRFGSKYIPSNYSMPPPNATHLFCQLEMGVGQFGLIFDDKSGRLWYEDKFVPSPIVTSTNIQFDLVGMNHRLSRINGSIESMSDGSLVRGYCKPVSSRQF